MIKLLSFFSVILLLFSSCKKDESSDKFCNLVEAQEWNSTRENDWTSVESVIDDELVNYTSSQWQRNCIDLAKTLEEKDCIKSAIANLNLLETQPQRTEITVQFIVNDSNIETKNVELEINEADGQITNCYIIRTAQ